VAIVLTSGQRHDSTQLEPVLTVIRVSRPGRGRPRTRPARLIADKGQLRPVRSDQRERRAHRPGRKPGFDRATDARRNVVERCMNRLKQWRELPTRCS